MHAIFIMFTQSCKVLRNEHVDDIDGQGDTRFKIQKFEHFVFGFDYMIEGAGFIIGQILHILEVQWIHVIKLRGNIIANQGEKHQLIDYKIGEPISRDMHN